MANEFSGGITFYKEGEYMFKFFGLNEPIRYCHIKDVEEFLPVYPSDHDLPNFTEAYNRAMNVFTSSYKPPAAQ